MKHELVMIRGLPGSGKSTMAKSMTGYMHYEADMYFMKDGEYKFDQSKIADAHKWCQCATRLALKTAGVVVSNTFTQKWEMQPYFDMAAELGVPVRVIEATGNFNNIHGVPEAAIERMRARWEEL